MDTPKGQSDNIIPFDKEDREKWIEHMEEIELEKEFQRDFEIMLELDDE